MKNTILLCLALSTFACSRINQDSKDYYRAKHVKHGIVILSPSLVQKLNEASAARGKVIYTQRCLACHGVSLTGDGPEADKQKNPPANLLKLVKEVDNFTFFMNVSEWQGSMPGWKEPISEIEKEDLVAYLKTFRTVSSSPAQN